MNEELKACPFCGKMPEIVGTPEVLIVHRCAANLDNIKLERFEVWQQRPLEDAQVARIKAKSEEINSLKRAYADLNFDDRTKFQEQSARIRALEAELAALRDGIDEAIENCETCRGEPDEARKCARCRTFANLLSPAQEVKK